MSQVQSSYEELKTLTKEVVSYHHSISQNWKKNSGHLRSSVNLASRMRRK